MPTANSSTISREIASIFATSASIFATSASGICKGELARCPSKSRTENGRVVTDLQRDQVRCTAFGVWVVEVMSMASNIVELVSQELPSSVQGRLASVIGEAPAPTSRAVSMGAPLILGGIAQRASAESGA